MARGGYLRTTGDANAQRVAVRSIDGLDGGGGFMKKVELKSSGKSWAFAACETVNQNRENNATSK